MKNLEKERLISKKRVALMQPTFLPWMGYFGLILDADEFVFLDDFQFVRRSFHQRNSLFVDKETAGFISVPVEHAGNQEATLNIVQTQMDEKWKRKFVGILKHNYSFSPWLKHYCDFVEGWLQMDFKNLAAFNIHFISFVLTELGIKTPTALSGSFGVTGKRSEKILGLLTETKARTYLSAYGAFDYMEEDDVFSNMAFEFLFQNFKPVEYAQAQGGGFVSHLSVLDSLLQQGPEKTLEAIRKSSGQFLSPQERKENISHA